MFHVSAAEELQVMTSKRQYKEAAAQLEFGDLAEEVSNIIDPQFADGVDMSEVQDGFSSVITKALVTLVHGLETKFDTEMADMSLV